MTLMLKFPRCWDGVNLDSSDHRSHMAYVGSWADDCPAGYDVRLSEIRVFVRYTTLGGPDASVDPSPGSMRLASGGIYSVHGDFIEAWDPIKQQAIIARCLWNDLVTCTS